MPLVLPLGQEGTCWKVTYGILKKIVYITKVCKGVLMPNFKTGWTGESVSEMCFMYLERML